MKHSTFEASPANGRLKGEARGVRDRLRHLLKSLDELVEPEEVSEPATVNRVRAILKSRRLREQHFDAGLFADPAWDMLLELYMAELGQYRISVSSLCASAAVPATTALRWMKTLEEKGLVMRHPDPSDGRRIFVALSDEAEQKMERVFGALPASERMI